MILLDYCILGDDIITLITKYHKILHLDNDIITLIK